MDNEINRHRIGRKLRRLRIRKSLSLAELGTHAGLSPPLLSKLETGKMVPTIPTLTRIALVFGVGLEHFFSGDRSGCEVIRRKDRIRMPMEGAIPAESVKFESLDFAARDRTLDSYLAIFERGDADAGVPEHEHEGEELVYVLKGTLGLKHDGVEYELRAGDSAYFEARFPHAYRRIGSAACETVVVVRR